MPGNVVGEAWVAIRPDLSGFDADLLAKVGASMTRLQAFADAKPITLRVNLDMTEALAQIAAVRAAAAGIGGGGGGRFITGAAAASAAGGSGGGGGLLTGAALGRLLGVGAGNTTGIPWTPFVAAGAFSALSFAGLGVEHVLFTLVGLVGSLAGAIGGGLLLAIGAASTALVGMGSDLAVLKSTITDTGALYKQLEVIRRAQIQYGTSSPQVTAAKGVLGVDMKMLGNTAGVAAELGLAKSVQALNIYWDKLTSNARIAAVSILQQFVNLGHDFVPLVANAAQVNLTIISNSLRPLFKWLEGPQGMGIFTQLETVFRQNLPNAMIAFTQGTEFVLRTMASLSSTAEGFTKRLADFFTYANSNVGWSKWQDTMATLISMFHTWSAFFVILLKDIVDLFKLTAGLGTGIVETLTKMLDKLHTWLNLTSTKDRLHNLFQLHKQEVLDILALIPPVLGALGHVYLTVAPLLTKALVDVLGALVPILAAITSNAWGAWLVGLTLILGKLGLLTTALGLIKGGVTSLLGIGGAAGAGLGVQKVWVVNMPIGNTPFGPPVPSPTISNGVLIGAPLLSQASNAWDVWGHVITYWQGVNKQISKDAVTIATRVRNTAQGANMSDQEMWALEAAIESGAVHTPAQITQFLKSWKGINGVQVTLSGIIGKTAPQIGTGFITLENQLSAMGLSWSKSVGASDALQWYITKFGPLTSTQMLAFYDDVTHGATSAYDIYLSLKSINENLNPGIESAAEISTALADLHKSIPGTIHLTGGGKGFFSGSNAIGGYVPAGKWGTKAEDEIVLGGLAGATVLNASQSRRAAEPSMVITNHFHINGGNRAEIEQVIKQSFRQLQLAYRAH